MDVARGGPLADRSKIEWTQATWNPVTGCSKVSPGCDRCYAETMSHRLSHSAKYVSATNPEGTWSGVLSTHPGELKRPGWWKEPKLVFVCSMSDLFHSQVPWDFICQVFAVMAATPWHTYQVLTKRPGRMAYFAEAVWPEYQNCHPTGPWDWPPNVWAGTSVESQKYAPRLNCLARVPAKVRFVSVEPMLGPVDLSHWLPCDLCEYPLAPEEAERNSEPCEVCGGTDGQGRISWVICGGESGSGARPMDLDWAKSLRNQCREAGVPLFVKQLGNRPFWNGEGPPPAGHVYLGRVVGGWRFDLLRDAKGGDPAEWPEDLRIREMPDV